MATENKIFYRWKAFPYILQKTILVLSFSSAKYASFVGARSAHTTILDPAFHIGYDNAYSLKNTGTDKQYQLVSIVPS